MASKQHHIEDTLNKIGDTIETILGGKKNTALIGYVGNGGNQSTLEKVGFNSRMEHMMRNGWNKEIPYSKLLVESEYDVQQEFEI